MNLLQQGLKSQTFCRKKTNKIKGKLRVTPKVKHLARVQSRCWRNKIDVNGV